MSTLKKYSELDSRSPALKRERDDIPTRFCCFFFKIENSENSKVSIELDSSEKSSKQIPLSIKLDSGENSTKELKQNSMNSEIKKFDAQEIIQTEYSCTPGSVNQKFSLNVGSYEEDEMSLGEVDHPDILEFFKRK
jgi:hypothetical protein